MKRLLFAMAALIMGVSVMAQSLPSKCEAYLPSILNTKVLRYADVQHLLSSSDYCQAESASGAKKHWIVYSDRADNIAYTSATSSTEANRLAMNQKVRIAKIQGRRALVYSEPVAATAWPKISANAQCLGWVPMDNLLLWDVCLSDETGVFQKAMLCLNADETGRDRGFGFLSPGVEEFKLALDPAFRIYYVMKEIVHNGKKMTLLSTQAKMVGSASDRNLYAWVPVDMYVAWNQRSCLETTWNKDDIAYFARTKFTASVYEKKELSNALSTRTFKLDPKDPEPDDDDEYYRWPGEATRFPILDGTTAGSSRYQCTALVGKMGGNFVDSSLIKQEKFYENRRNINIILLLDATRSMDVFSQSVYDAISQGCAYFDGSKYKVKIGVVLYRDQADGENELETLKFTQPGDPKLLEFIQTGGKYGYTSSDEDKTNTESLFYGMNEALKRFRNPEQSNVLIVVGDCGNNATDDRVTQQQLIDAIVEKEVNVIGFQVRNEDRVDWSVFNTDVQQIILSSLQTKYDKIAEGSRVSGRPNENFTGYVFTNNLDAKNVIFMAEHRHALSGQEIAPDNLRTLMTDVIAGYANKMQELFDLAQEMRIKGGKSVGFQKNLDGDVINQGDWSMSEEFLLQKFGTKNVTGLIGFTGWSPKMKDERPIWMATVLFTHEELVELLAGLEDLYNVARTPQADNRKPFEKAVKECVKKMAPGTNFDTSDLNHLLQRVYGINEPTPIMKYPVVDVLDNQRVSNAEYRAIMSKFKTSYENLRSIKDNNTYKYKMKYNGVTYYWIPVQDMP